MRVDVYLAEYGYAPSRQRAKSLIEGGLVFIDGKRVQKPSEQIEDSQHAVDVTDTLAYVGRGGLKLEAALASFSIQVSGITALDIGASTGGFTDCLLQNGAKKVYAVDAGEGQLAPKLLRDQRVVCKEHFNARNLTLDDLDGTAVDCIVMDVSFISATYILPRFPLVLKERGNAICLIKPQFEVGRAMIGKGGIVKGRAAYQYAIERVFSSAYVSDLIPVGLIPSPILGGDGNREFLVHLQYHSSDLRKLNEDDIYQLLHSI